MGDPKVFPGQMSNPSSSFWVCPSQTCPKHLHREESGSLAAVISIVFVSVDEG